MRRLLAILLLMIPLQGFSQWIRFPVEYWTVTPKADTLTFYLVGDVLAHGRVVQSASVYGYTDFFKHVEGNIRKADVAVCNMEFPLGGKPYTGYPVFSGPESFAEYLSDVGFDVLLTANNHMLDKGFEGLSRTIGQLEERDILYTGTAASAPSETSQRARLSCWSLCRVSYSTPQWGKTRIMSAFSRARAMTGARASRLIRCTLGQWTADPELVP